MLFMTFWVQFQNLTKSFSFQGLIGILFKKRSQKKTKLTVFITNASRRLSLSSGSGRYGTVAIMSTNAPQLDHPNGTGTGSKTISEKWKTTNERKFDLPLRCSDAMGEG